MTRNLRASRTCRLTASFGLSISNATAAVSVLSIIAAAVCPTAALARPSKHHRHSGDDDSSTPTHRVAKIRVSTAHLRSKPGEESHSTALLDEGNTARVVGHKGDWDKIRLESGREGWVRSDLIRMGKATKHAEAEHVAEEDSSHHSRRHHSDDEDSSSTAHHSRHHAPAAKEVHVASKPHPKKTVQVAHVSRPKKATPEHSHSAAPTKSVAKAAPAPTAPVKIAAAAPAPGPVTTAEVVKPEDTTAAQVAAGTTTPEATTETNTNPVTETAASAVAPTPPPAPIQVAQAETPKPSEHKSEKSDNIVPDRNLSRGERVARTALSYRGTPYRMGATGRGAFDCSGFTMYLFDKEGTSLPRTAEEQYHKGQPIDKANLRPGDLVFFKNTYKQGISHVGIYIGNGQFCHASGYGRGVRVDTLDKAYYINHWAGARRPR